MVSQEHRSRAYVLYPSKDVKNGTLRECAVDELGIKTLDLPIGNWLRALSTEQ